MNAQQRIGNVPPIRLSFIFLSLLLLVSGCVTYQRSGDTKIFAEILEYGIYESSAPHHDFFHPDVANKKVTIAGPMIFTEQTQEIPAILNTKFGFSCRIWGLPTNESVKITTVTRHPKITSPDLRTTKGFAYYQQLIATNDWITNGVGYVFEEPYELVNGKWSMEIWVNNHRLIEQTFLVVDPKPN